MYLVASILWLWPVQHTGRPIGGMVGAGVCVTGAAVILFGPCRA
ncbi:MAG: hypothetical protein EON96_10685 [Caulobacteraceae bacterium]|nr:MAG: hypothetical protein EON96_10685 [Caulobacteraceae bacterium]